MKKIICLCLCMMICFTAFNAVFAEYNGNPLNLEQEDYDALVKGNIRHSIAFLSRIDIVRNPFEKWDEFGNLARRNAFEMVLLVTTSRAGWRGLPELEQVSEQIFQFTGIQDVEYGTYDYSLLDALDSQGLISGRVDYAGKHLAAFDEPITYYEALDLLSRLFTTFYVHYIYNKQIQQTIASWDEEYPYYKFAEEIGLINGNNLVNYSILSVDESQLNEPIPAYEFMHLLYTALYIPHLNQGGDYSTNTVYDFRYIDLFSKEYTSPWEGTEFDENEMYIP